MKSLLLWLSTTWKYLNLLFFEGKFEAEDRFSGMERITNQPGEDKPSWSHGEHSLPMEPLGKLGLPCPKIHCTNSLPTSVHMSTTAGTKGCNSLEQEIQLNCICFISWRNRCVNYRLFPPHSSCSKLITSACNTTVPSFALYWFTQFTVNSDEKQWRNVDLSFNFSCYRLATTLPAA